MQEKIKILLSWENVPFVFRGNTKSGSDCIGFIYGFLEDIKYNGYLKNLFLDYGNNFNKSFELFNAQRYKFRFSDNISSLNILVFKMNKNRIHFGIAVNKNSFIHACMRAKKIIITDLNSQWYSKITAIILI